MSNYKKNQKFKCEFYFTEEIEHVNFGWLRPIREIHKKDLLLRRRMRNWCFKYVLHAWSAETNNEYCRKITFSHQIDYVAFLLRWQGITE